MDWTKLPEILKAQEKGRRQGIAEAERGYLWKILHPSIRDLSRKRFESGHYADSVEAAFKEVNHRVKIAYLKAGYKELDGSDLMYQAFSLKGPFFFGDVGTETGRSMQDGYQKLFAGAMLAIRNPKAHANITISPERAAEFLGLASLLMNKLDEISL